MTKINMQNKMKLDELREMADGDTLWLYMNEMDERTKESPKSLELGLYFPKRETYTQPPTIRSAYQYISFVEE